jgi:hypothetical protein
MKISQTISVKNFCLPSPIMSILKDMGIDSKYQKYFANKTRGQISSNMNKNVDI